MKQEDLISELLQALTNDVQGLKKQVDKLPTQAPADYRANIERLAQAVQELRQTPKPAAAAIDLSPITARLDRIEQQSRQRPEYKMSQYVQYGAYAFGLMVVLLVVMTWFALDWKGERDKYQQAYTHDNWRVRYTEQANPDYYAYMEGMFSKEPAKVQQWIEEQEQADAAREAARRAAEQAAAMNAQADKLEGKKGQKGKKR